MKYGAVISILFLFFVIGTAGCMSSSEEQVPTEDDKLLYSHVLDEADNFGYVDLTISALSVEEYDLAIEYANKAKYETDQRLSAVNGLSVSTDFQPMKSTFLEYLKSKNDVIFNLKTAAESMKRGDLAKSLEYMKYANNDMDKLPLRVEEMTLQLKEIDAKYPES